MILHFLHVSTRYHARRERVKRPEDPLHAAFRLRDDVLAGVQPDFHERQRLDAFLKPAVSHGSGLAKVVQHRMHFAFRQYDLVTQLLAAHVGAELLEVRQCLALVHVRSVKGHLVARVVHVDVCDVDSLACLIRRH